jgi:signal-transduction protein with cAMP-binding, CBS, and nucleotidyltransferase domain
MRIVSSEIDKMFSLKSVQPFDKLDERTLFNISEVMRLSKFEPNQIILPENEVSNEVLVLVDGGIMDIDGNSVVIAGINSILNDTVVENRLIAGENGCKCLRIGKGHFLTTVYECPSILTDLIQLRNIHPHYFM